METIERALLIDPDNLRMRYNFACVLSAYLKEHEAALDLLEPVLAQSGPTLTRSAAFDSDFDHLRRNSRFESALVGALERLGIGPKPIDETAV